MKVGFYFSLIDWHHPGYTVDIGHPQRPKDKRDWTQENFDRLNAGKDMKRFREFMFAQVRELLTDYGKIDVIWYDFRKSIFVLRKRTIVSRETRRTHWAGLSSR